MYIKETAAVWIFQCTETCCDWGSVV